MSLGFANTVPLDYSSIRYACTFAVNRFFNTVGSKTTVNMSIPPSINNNIGVVNNKINPKVKMMMPQSEYFKIFI